MWNPLTCSWLMNDTAYLMVWEIASFFATLTSSLWWVFLASKIRNKHVALGKIVNFCISSGSRLVHRQLQQWYCVTLLKRSWCCILLFLLKCKCGDHIFFLVLGTVLICGSSISVFVPSLLKQSVYSVWPVTFFLQYAIQRAKFDERVSQTQSGVAQHALDGVGLCLLSRQLIFFYRQSVDAHRLVRRQKKPRALGPLVVSIDLIDANILKSCVCQRPKLCLPVCW